MNIRKVAIRSGMYRPGGYAAVMAMLLLVLGTTAAMGLYALVRTSTKLNENEQATALADAALDSGLQFYKWQIAQAVQPVTTSLSIQNAVIWCNGLSNSMITNIEGHNGVIVNSTQYVPPIPKSDLSALTQAMSITFAPISFGKNSMFWAVLTSDTQSPPSLTLKVSAQSTTAAGNVLNRSVTVAFNVLPGTPGAPMLFPLAAKGGIPKSWNVTPDGSTKVKQYGNAITVPLTDGTTGTILQYPSPAPQWNNQPVAFPDQDNVISAVGALSLPVLSAKAGSTINGTAQSVSIPPNSNYTLTGTLNGIIYIQWPNNITIQGNTTINGTIIMQRAPSGGGGNSTLTMNRTGTISRPMGDTQSGSLAALMTPSITPQFTTADGWTNSYLKWWSIIAPDAVLSIPNGTTGGAIKSFEGSLLIWSFSRQGGGDKAGFEITLGGIAAESTDSNAISIGSNGASYEVAPDTTQISGAGGTQGSLSLTWNSYDEGGLGL